jgi:hypothetical protein
VSRRKHIRELRQEAERLGYVLEGRTKRNHVRWRNAHGFLVITSSDIPTDRHRRNCETFLRRHAKTKLKSILARHQKRP